MIIVRTAESADDALADGRMHCPRSGCGGTLTRWGYGRRRRIRGLGPASSPLIDWGWHTAGPRIRKGHSKGDPREPHPCPKLLEGRSMQPWVHSHVMFPHVFAVVIGTILFVLGLFGLLGPV